MSNFSYSVFRTAQDTTASPRYLDGVAASSTNTYYSDSWRGTDDFGLTVFTTGNLTGTWTLWATDKPNPGLTNDNDWVDISAHAEFVETNPAGATSKWKVSSTLIRSGKLRLKYVNASGTGSLFAYVNVG